VHPGNRVWDRSGSRLPEHILAQTEGMLGTPSDGPVRLLQAEDSKIDGSV